MINIKLYKQALASFPTGVTIVTAYDENDRITGLTVSAFAALSMNPPLVLVCPNYHSETYPVLSTSKYFAINILASDQQGLAFAFSKTGAAKISAIRDIPLGAGRTNVPIVKGAVAVLECSFWNEYAGGDHAILIGKVQHIRFNQENTPIVYCRGKMTAQH